MKAIKTLIFITILTLIIQSCSKESKCDRVVKKTDTYNDAIDLMMSGLEDKNKTKYNRGRNKIIDFYDCSIIPSKPLTYEQALERYEDGNIYPWYTIFK